MPTNPITPNHHLHLTLLIAWGECTEDEPLVVDTLPIIGWEWEQTKYSAGRYLAKPITVQELPASPYVLGILDKSGEVILVGDYGCYDSRQDFERYAAQVLPELTQEWHRQQARRHSMKSAGL